MAGMKSKPSFWQRIGLHDWLLNKHSPGDQSVQLLTTDSVYRYVVQKFSDSIRELSFANRVVFYHEYIIIINAEDYQQFIDHRKGIFGLIVQECIREFYATLSGYQARGKHVEPSASKWVFRFVSHPEYGNGDMGFIGKLLPGATKKQENLRVTYIPRQTGIAETRDVSDEVLKGFTFYSEGYYEVPFSRELLLPEIKPVDRKPELLARFETFIPDKAYAGKKLEYLMNEEDVIVSGLEDKREGSNLLKIPSEWVNSPHLRIRYDRNAQKFFLASFGDRTMLNEKLVTRSDSRSPQWIELPMYSKLMLNGIVGINIFKA